jgi:hypothetical protein
MPAERLVDDVEAARAPRMRFALSHAQTLPSHLSHKVRGLGLGFLMLERGLPDIAERPAYSMS